jgi:hypothetical protein
LCLYGPSAFDRATFEPSLELLYHSDKIKHGKHCYDGTLQRWLSEYRDYEYRSCPCQWTHPLAGHALSCAINLKSGALPFEGGIMDQPAHFWELVQIASSFLRKKEAAEQKAQASKRKKK